MSEVMKFEQDLMACLGLSGKPIKRLRLTLEAGRTPVVNVEYEEWTADLSSLSNLQTRHLKLVEDEDVS
jgi:hypothetical protein